MSYLVFHKSGSSLFNYTMEFLSDVAKTLPNAVFHFQKACNFKAFRSFRDYSHSTVAGGLLVMSYTTLDTCFTSLGMRVPAASSTS